MNRSLFDLVTSSNVVAYWLEKNVNEQPMLGETLFPYKTYRGSSSDKFLNLFFISIILIINDMFYRRLV